MKKILIVSDSLGYPRTSPEKVSDEDCWSFNIVDEFSSKFKIRTWLKPGLDTQQLINDSVQHLNAVSSPDIVILQVGIVDCYPRALKKNELSLLLRMPNYISSFFHKIIKKHYSFLVKKRSICYVEPDNFEKNLLAFRSFFASSKFIVIPIAPPSADYMKKNPLVRFSIEKYNSILGAVFGEQLLNDVYYSVNCNFLMSDGHHLNQLGNKIIYDKISEVINDSI